MTGERKEVVDGDCKLRVGERLGVMAALFGRCVATLASTVSEVEHAGLSVWGGEELSSFVVERHGLRAHGLSVLQGRVKITEMEVAHRAEHANEDAFPQMPFELTKHDDWIVPTQMLRTKPGDRPDCRLPRFPVGLCCGDNGVS